MSKRHAYIALANHKTATTRKKTNVQTVVYSAPHTLCHTINTYTALVATSWMLCCSHAIHFVGSVANRFYVLHFLFGENDNLNWTREQIKANILFSYTIFHTMFFKSIYFLSPFLCFVMACAGKAQSFFSFHRNTRIRCSLNTFRLQKPHVL